MAVLSPQSIAKFRALKADLAFPDPYDVLRPVSGGTDYAGNEIVSDTPAVVETGYGRILRISSNTREALIAERLGWTAAYSIELPYGTLAKASDQIRSNGRLFELAGDPIDTGRWAISKIAVVQEVG